MRIALLALALAGCGSTGREMARATDGGTDVAAPDATDAASSTVSFTREIFPLVKRTCTLTGCHDRVVPTNHFTDFTTAESAHVRWVGGPGFDFCADGGTGLFVERRLVVPGHPEESYLVEKLSSKRTDLCRDGHHPRMPPPPSPPWSDDAIERVVTWIRDGAPFN